MNLLFSLPKQKHTRSIEVITSNPSNYQLNHKIQLKMQINDALIAASTDLKAKLASRSKQVGNVTDGNTPGLLRKAKLKRLRPSEICVSF